jgi:hypothetical protein
MQPNGTGRASRRRKLSQLCACEHTLVSAAASAKVGDQRLPPVRWILCPEVDGCLGQSVGAGVHDHPDRARIVLQQRLDDRLRAGAGLTRAGVLDAIILLAFGGDTVKVIWREPTAGMLSQVVVNLGVARSDSAVKRRLAQPVRSPSGFQFLSAHLAFPIRC